MEGRDTVEAAREVAAMQFAGGLSVACIAEQWDQDTDWVEEAIRRVLLASIPRRDGGLKASRAEIHAERRGELAAARGAQGELEW